MADLSSSKVYGNLTVTQTAYVQGEIDLSSATVTGVSKSDVGLGSVENKALSNASWSDLSISQSDVSASDVGLGRVANASMNVVDTEPSSGSGQDGDVWFVV